MSRTALGGSDVARFVMVDAVAGDVKVVPCHRWLRSAVLHGLTNTPVASGLQDGLASYLHAVGDVDVAVKIPQKDAKVSI